MGDKGKRKLLICDYHRNGISGRSFKVGIVDDKEDGVRRRMLVVRPYEADDKEGVECYVFDIEKIAKGDVRFFHNSWRGDHYHEEFDAQWDATKAAQDGDKEFYTKPIEQLLPPRATDEQRAKEAGDG